MEIDLDDYEMKLLFYKKREQLVGATSPVKNCARILSKELCTRGGRFISDATGAQRTMQPQ